MTPELDLPTVLRMVADGEALAPSHPKFQRYAKLLLSAQRKGLVESVNAFKSLETAEAAYDEVYVYGGLTAEGEDYIRNIDVATGTADMPDVTAADVMVVVGRSARINSSMFQLLRALHLQPFEFEKLVSETGSAAPYVGAAVEVGFKRCRAAIVLLTPDDIVRLRPELGDVQSDAAEMEEQFQPRPNVLFEAGMALALHPERTLIVAIGQTKIPSDLLGRHVIRFDGSPKKRSQLAERLRTAGCGVDTRGEEWLAVGDFSQLSGAISQPSAAEKRADLGAVEKRILEYLVAAFEAREPAIYEFQICAGTGLLRAQVAVALESLNSKGFLRTILTMGSGISYEISAKGIEAIV